MIEEHFNKLLEKDWENEEKEMIQRIMEGLLYYKKILPKTLKTDVVCAIGLCNRLKDEVEELKKKVIELLEQNEKDNEKDNQE